MAVRGAFDKAIAPGLFGAYADEYESLPARYTDIFNIMTTGRAYETILVTTGLGTTPAKPESSNVAIDTPLQVGTVVMRVNSYGLGYEISRELYDDDLYGVVGVPASRFLAQSGRDTEERQAWALINNAFTNTTGTLSYDGLSIVNTVHTLKGGGTYANRPGSTTALSFSALQASLERHMLMVNERSLKIRQQPSWLIVPIQLSWLADEILNSTQKPFTADNTTNVLAKGKIGLTAYPSEFMTSATAWVTLTPKGKHKLDFFWRTKPYMDKDFDKKAQVAQMMNFFRFGTAAFDWRGIDGSP